MIDEATWLTVGKLVASQGLKGEIRVQPLSDFQERFTKPGKRWLQKKKEEPQEVQLISGRKLPGKSVFIIRLAKINTRTEANSTIGSKLLVPAKERPKLDANEFHFLDLLGLEAKLSINAQPIGRVTNLTNAGNDLLEIELSAGRKVLVPFVEPIVPIVNIKEGWLILTPPPGLLEL